MLGKIPTFDLWPGQWWSSIYPLSIKQTWIQGTQLEKGCVTDRKSSAALFMHNVFAPFIQKRKKRKTENNSARQHWFVLLCLPAAFFRLSLRFSPHCAQSCVIRPSCMDKKGIKGMPNSFKGLSSPSYHHVKLKTTQFGAFPPRQTSKRSKAWESFQRVCLFIYFFVWRGGYSSGFYFLLQRKKKKEKLKVKN